MNNTKKTIGGYAYLSPDIDVRNAGGLKTLQDVRAKHAEGAGQSIGGTKPKRSTYASARLSNPLAFT